jgi:hypothetical protein
VRQEGAGHRGPPCGRGQKESRLQRRGAVGADGASSRKGRKCAAVFAGMKAGDAIFAAEGKGADTLADLAARSGSPRKIGEIAMDMSPRSSQAPPSACPMPKQPSTNSMWPKSSTTPWPRRGGKSGRSTHC